MRRAGTFAAASSVFVGLLLGRRMSVVTFATPGRVEGMGRATGRLRRQLEFADKISNRDFIYGIVLCAAFDLLWIFLWLIALGSAFFLLYLSRRLGAIPEHPGSVPLAPQRPD